MPRAKTRKRPCAICRRWFTADPRQIGRQKSCGKPDCQSELHRRQCVKWNRKNKNYYKAIYLSNKIERSKDPPDCNQTKAPPLIPASRSDLALPKEVIVETTGTELLIVLDYIIEQIIHREPKLSVLEPP
ncbi:hypothetical protein D1AOALGA4SA_427 [Olavius algarvensis Delta 1 endosymbiont]|nr:hypothetical protein D1AOALGA4SA_427 [Olavius algarvensis Delta 1 endosymbiont]